MSASIDRRARLLLLTHIAATLFMTGIIWFVQIVHYPLLTLIGPLTFAAYERANIASTAAVVGPVMILEALTCVLLIARRPAKIRRGEAWLGANLLACIWASTALVQFPMHEALISGFDGELLRKLALTNWLRTLLWSARALLVLRMGSHSLKS